MTCRAQSTPPDLCPTCGGKLNGACAFCDAPMCLREWDGLGETRCYACAGGGEGPRE